MEAEKSWVENLRQGIMRAGPFLISGSYLFGMLILPVIALLSKAAVIPPADFWRIATEPVALSAYYVTLSMAVCATFFNGVFGFILAWVLSRYDFPGKQVRARKETVGRGRGKKMF
jgi:sulfate transport system permease protein